MYKPTKFQLGECKEVLSTEFVADHLDRCWTNSDLEVVYTEGDKSTCYKGSFDSFAKLYRDAVYYTTLSKDDDFKPSASLKASAKRVIKALDKSFKDRGEGYCEKV